MEKQDFDSMSNASLAMSNVSCPKAATLQAKGGMVDNIAYQIRTLANAVIGFSDLLLMEELTSDQLDYAREINIAGKGLADLAAEVLEWELLGSGRAKAVEAACSLKSILDEIERAGRPAAEEKGLVFELTWDSGLPESITTDSDRLLKCLMNLVANAIQYTQEGSVRIDVRMEVRQGAGTVRFDIIDTGQGILPERLETLFDAEMNEVEANAQAVTMLGRRISAVAGLPLTQKLAELLGGSLEVQSEMGRGSTFSLRIPVGVDVASESRSSRPAAASAGAGSAAACEDTKTLPILLVEDQESNRMVICLMLQSMGYEVDTAVDGQEAIEKAMSREYGLILMDLKMPRMGGYEAARYLREHQVKVPMVVLSAMVLDHEENRAISELFDGLLTKPIGSEQLMAAIDNYAKGAVGENAARALMR